MSKDIEKKMCKCTHTVDGDMKLKPSKDYKSYKTDGSLKYICTVCGKEVVIRNRSDAEIDEAIEIIDDMIDFIKYALSESEQDDDGNIIIPSDEEMNNLKKLGKKFQFCIRNEIKALYNAARCKAPSHRRRKKKRADDIGSEWCKP